MATLQVRSIDDDLYKALGKLAECEHRSISQEVIYILKNYLSKPSAYNANMTDDFLKLAGTWKDERDADAIITDINSSRTFAKKRFTGKF